MAEENGELKKLLDEWKKDNTYLTKVSKEIVFNSERPIQDRYVGLMILLDYARDKKLRIDHGIRRLESYLNSLCESALKEYKKKRVIEFTEKWAGKDVNEQMALEMQALEKPNHCYTFSGITVVELDCNLCKSRKCQQGDADYTPNQFEGLLGGYTEPMPEGTHSIDTNNQKSNDLEIEKDEDAEEEVDNDVE